jgi:hypothetical protein
MYMPVPDCGSTYDQRNARGQVSLELPVTGGTLATSFNDYEVAVRRPDGLSAHRSGDLPGQERRTTR